MSDDDGSIEMALTEADFDRIGGVVAKELRPIEKRLGRVEGRLDEHVRMNGTQQARGLVAGVGGWLKGLTGWQRVIAIGILGGVVVGVACAVGRVPGT
jgi:hypothetical protein